VCYNIIDNQWKGKSVWRGFWIRWEPTPSTGRLSTSKWNISTSNARSSSKQPPKPSNISNNTSQPRSSRHPKRLGSGPSPRRSYSTGCCCATCISTKRPFQIWYSFSENRPIRTATICLSWPPSSRSLWSGITASASSSSTKDPHGTRRKMKYCTKYSQCKDVNS